ncbi:unnamed protein product [Linum tenue]|uniref:Uncharacterized protein n=2 Tax=Linum tenue TaxID=586396 RepID=A0AAV0PDP3_9ROSI|nr:unnamed protein product [Linum tenue]
MVNLSVSSVFFPFRFLAFFLQPFQFRDHLSRIRQSEFLKALGRTRELEQRRPSTMAVWLVEEEIVGSRTNPRIALLIFVCVPVNLVSLRGAAGAKLRQRRSGDATDAGQEGISGSCGGAALYIAAYAHG